MQQYQLLGAVTAGDGLYKSETMVLYHRALADGQGGPATLLVNRGRGTTVMTACHGAMTSGRDHRALDMILSAELRLSCP